MEILVSLAKQSAVTRFLQTGSRPYQDASEREKSEVKHCHSDHRLSSAKRCNHRARRPTREVAQLLWNHPALRGISISAIACAIAESGANRMRFLSGVKPLPAGPCAVLQAVRCSATGS